MSCCHDTYKPLMCCLLFVAAFYSQAIERERYYNGAMIDKGDVYRLTLDSVVSGLWFETRCAVVDNKDGRERSWRLFWADGVDGDTINVVVSWGNTAFATEYDVRYMRIKALRADSLIASVDLTKDIDLYSGHNSLAVRIEDKEASVFIGNRQLRHIIDFHVSGYPVGDIVVDCDKKLDVQRSYTKSKSDIRNSLQTDWTLDCLRTHISRSDDPMEAFWTYLDRENDPDKAVLGGRYILASVKSDRGYDLIYVSGAKTNRQNWVCGMRKGRIIPTVFADNYDLLWYDAMIDPMDAEDEANAAVTEQGQILTVNFPLLSTRMRFAKVIGQMRP